MPRYLGIDPGAKGSLCLLDPCGDITFYFTPFAFNTTRPATGFKNPSTIDLFRQLDTESVINPIVLVGIEDVHSLFGMSAKSNFNFGRNVQAVTTLIHCLGMQYQLVQPKVWQKTIELIPGAYKGDPKGLKQAIATKALELYPGVTLYGPKGGLMDGRSDALMIAHYLRLQHQGEF